MSDADLKVTISVPRVPMTLAQKLDAIAAALSAVREAHRDTMPSKTWCTLYEAQQLLAQATLSSSSAAKSQTPVSGSRG